MSNDKDIVILKFLIENGNKPTTASAIATKTCAISKKWSIKRCTSLSEDGVLEYVEKIPFRSVHKAKHYFIASNPYTIHVLFDRLKKDRDNLHMVMQSPYYLDMIPPLCDHFNTQLRSEGMPEMTEIEREFLALILKYSETALDFVLVERPDKCKESFKKLEANTKQDRMNLVEMYKDVDRVNDIMDSLFLSMRQFMAGEEFNRIRRNIEQNNIRATLKKLSKRPDTDLNKRLTDTFLNAEHPTWMSLFDELYSKDRYFYDFWLSDEDKRRLDKLMLDKIYFSCKKNDT